jgi:hypothetical protein
MRKSLILFLTAVGGSASYAAGITEVGRDAGVADPSTWRWYVSSILADQQKAISPAIVTAADAGSFDQAYQRYSPLGVPEPRRDSSP